MIFTDIKYSQLISNVEKWHNKLQDWEKVRNFEFLNGLSPEDSLNLIKQMCLLENDDLNIEIWDQLINYLENRDKKNKVTTLGKGTFNDAKIPEDKYSTWQLYKHKLIKQNWSENSIRHLEKSSFEILRNLSMDTVESGPIKGLVVGNVQSGKTANMAGLIAMAADNGFNFFIILSGVIENLRQQTANRLYSDLNISGNGNLHWHHIDRPSLRSKLPEHDISKYNLASNARDRYFTVCLKNSTRLNSLIKWLYDDKNKAKQLKILVIDDEADQASINTNDIEEEDRTKINKLIIDLVNGDVRGMNYIAYTATPYANILNETSENSLYPKDFITLLEPSEDYIGPKQIFGTENPEMSPSLEIVRDIPISDVEQIRQAHKDNAITPMVSSLRDSIHWFILTVAAMRAIDYRKPISMLVHTSFRINDHLNTAEAIEQYLRYLKNNYKKIKPKLKALYENEALDFKRSYFLEGMPNYSTADDVPDYPKWSEVERYIDRIIRLDNDEYLSHIPIGEEGQPIYHKGFHLVIDNSRASAENQIVRLVYPNRPQSTAPAFIVIGGNTLSRGLTLEGLTTTYFLRTTSQADTLMQMARWFGYRKGYEIFPRVWLDSLALERFQFLSQLNEELREEIAEYAKSSGLTPSNYAPRVRNSYNNQFIRITSSNKMQSAEPKEYDFSGFNSQTVYFENDESKLEHNLILTKNFLNSLPKPEVKRNHLIWRNIPTENVKDYLLDYLVCEIDIRMSNLAALIEWVEKNAGKLADWSVILSSVGKVEETIGKEDFWNIHGYSPHPVKRTKLKYRSTEKIANIGALRVPTDLLADIDAELTAEERNATKISEVRMIRDKHGFGAVPQLIVYRIDKGNEQTDEMKSQHRVPLNFPKDIIGINVMIPGMFRGGQLATYISAKINLNDADD